MQLDALGSTTYWTDLVADDGAYDLTIVLPTGRAMESITPHLALSTDGLLLPEIVLALDGVVRDAASRAARVRTMLDIDLYEELKSTGTVDSNVLLIGSADVNLGAELLLDRSRSYDVMHAGFTKPYEHPFILGVRGARYAFTVSPNTGLLAMYANCWSQRPRIALLCAGLFATGTIASVQLLLSYFKGRGDGNNRFNPEIPLKIIDGVPRSYFHVGLKPIAECLPQMDVVNISGITIKE